MANIQEQDGSVITEVKPETTVVGGKKKAVKASSGDLIVDIANEIENINKTKLVAEAEKLAENIEVNYFRLGGVLKRIIDLAAFEGYDNFDLFVLDKFGFKSRKARYLISIYNNLVSEQIPWDKVSHLGWTKLKDLAELPLTLDNVDKWAALAEQTTVAELKAAIDASKNGGAEGEGEVSEKTTDDIVKLNFKLKQDQADVVQSALAKAKGELHTNFDTVALENICAGYVGGTNGVPAFDLDEIIKTVGVNALLKRVADLFPEYDIHIAAADGTGDNAESANETAVA